MTKCLVLNQSLSLSAFSGLLLGAMVACSHENSQGNGDGSGGAMSGATGGNNAGDGGSQASGGAGAGTNEPGTGGSDALGSGGGTGEPKRTFVYMGSGEWDNSVPGKITVFEMNRSTKALSFVSDHDAGGLASYLAIDTQNLRVFSADENSGGVHSFTIDADTGSLTANGSTPSANKPVYLSLTTDKKFLLGANYGQGSVDVYPINDSGQAQASVQTVNTGSNAHSIVMDGMSRVLVANKGGDSISRFTFAAGTLTSQTPPTTALGSPRHITFGPDGRAYVVGESTDQITAFTVEDDGQLSLAWQKSRLPAGDDPASDTGADIRLTPDGKFLYASNRGDSNTVVAYNISGAAPQLIEHEPTLGQIPRSMAMDPQGKFLMVGNRGDNKIVVFSIAVDGSLSHVVTESTDSNPYFVTVVEL